MHGRQLHIGRSQRWGSHHMCTRGIGVWAPAGQEEIWGVSTARDVLRRL